MKYAPIAIPTLNRIEHLKRCLESLENNTGADKTDVYISVDYPKLSKHREGYIKVVSYLTEKEKNNRFNALHVFFQEKNLGPAENTYYLYRIIRKTYDTVISTEDDNEFSPNFLEYINKGLEIFREDERIISINGCKEADWISKKSNFVPLKIYPPYGVGKWFDKEEKNDSRCRDVLLHPECLTHKRIRKLKNEDRTIFDSYILDVLLSSKPPFWSNGELRIIDTVKTIYMHLCDKFVIVPMISKARTWGNDGSGVNMQKISDLKPEIEFPLDNEVTFEYIFNGVTLDNPHSLKDISPNKENDKIESVYMKKARGIKRNIKAEIGYWLLAACKYDYKKAREIIEKIYKAKE